MASRPHVGCGQAPAWLRPGLRRDTNLATDPWSRIAIVHIWPIRSLIPAQGQKHSPTRPRRRGLHSPKLVSLSPALARLLSVWFSPQLPKAVACMLAARKKKFQSARRMSRSTVLASEFLMISQSCEYGSVSTRKDWGMMVPTFIMIVPTFMVPDIRVFPYVGAANEKSASKRKSLVLRRGFRSFRANLIRR
jgi:hypothetical protein